MCKKQALIMIMPLFLCLGMLLLLTTPVLAEGEEPPPESMVTETPAPEETPVPPIIGESGAVEPPVLEAAAPPPDEGSQPAEDLAAVAAALAQQDLTLTDEKGELLSLASQEVLQAADPWFRVGTLIYRFINGDCSSVTAFVCQESTTPIQAALDYIVNHGTLPTDRTLYIEADDYDEDVELDGTLGPLAQMTRIIGNDDSDTKIKGDFEIHHTIAGFTLQGLSIYGNLWMHDNIGTLTLRDLTVSSIDNDGILVESQSGSINLVDVHADYNDGRGASLDNFLVVAPVSVTNSTFNHNKNVLGITGLAVQSRGPVTLNGVSARYNTGDGVGIETRAPVTIRNSVFGNNDGWGLWAWVTVTPGNILVENSDSTINGDDGFWFTTPGSVTVNTVRAIDNSGSGLVVPSNGATTVTITNSQFWSNDQYGIYAAPNSGFTGTAIAVSENVLDGLFVNTRGNILLNYVVAYDNDADGLNLNNAVTGGYGTITINGTQGVNELSENGANGLSATSFSTITLNTVFSHDNDGRGAYLSNDFTLRTAGINLVDNTFNSNDDYGLEVYSRGAINWRYGGVSWNGLTAPSGTSGAFFDNRNAVSPASVSLSFVTISNNYNGSGLEILSRGAITLSDVDSYENQNGSGVYLYNVDGTAGVSVTGTSTRNFNRNNGYGLSIYTNGPVIFRNIQANDNNGYGAYLDLLISRVGTPVTLTNVEFNNNRATGLYVLTRGPITATNISAGNNNDGVEGMDYNDIGGAYLDNTAGSGAITILRTNPLWNNWFGNNEGDGLTILANGNISVTRLSASNNAGSGAQLDNCLYNGSDTDFNCYGTGTVSINNPIGYASDFYNNWGSGLLVSSRYAITAGNIGAGNNANHGAQFDNNWTNSSGAVTLTASVGYNNDFSNNCNRGLGVYSRGAITINRVSANNNGNYGAALGNPGALTPQPVTVNGGDFSRNHNDGLRITSKGQVTVTDAWANENDVASAGMNLGESVRERIIEMNMSDGDTWWFNVDTEQDVQVLLDSAEFDGYLEIWAEAGVSYLDYNDDCSAGTTNACLNVHLAAGQYYVVVRSAGADQMGHYLLSLSDADRNHFYRNGASGIDVSTDVDGGIGGVTIVSSTVERVSFNNNSSTGVLVHTRGALRLSNMDASNNGGFGAYIDAHNTGLGAASNLLNVSFNSNRMTGLHLVTRGPITATNIDSGDNQNGDNEKQSIDIGGAYLDNTAGSGAVSILRTNPLWHNWFGNNEGTGLTIKARGNISLVRVAVNDNTGGGAMLDNCLWSGSELDNTCSGTGTITITNALGYSSYFDNNWGIGLKAASRSAVTVTNITSSNNGSGGAQLFNKWANASGAVSILSLTGHVTDFSNNGGYGLEVRSMGAITATRIVASNNGFIGALLANSGALFAAPVTVTGTDFSGNHNDGLNITSRGQVTLTDVSANNNDIVQSPNIDLGTSVNERITDQNVSTGDKWWFTVDVAQNVDIKMDSDDLDAYLALYHESDELLAANDDYEIGSLNSRIYQYMLPGRYYVIAKSSGSDQTGNYLLSLNDSTRINFNRNGANGLDISTNVTGGVGGVTINITSVDGQSFSDNSSTGILINSRNAISARNVHADNNGGYGALLDNCQYDDGTHYCVGIGTVTLAGYSNSFNNNVQSGLYVYSTGNINAADIFADNNRINGVLLANFPTAANVTLTSTHAEMSWRNDMSGNGLHGIAIFTRGIVTINRAWAFSNNGIGAYVYSADAPTPKAVTFNNSMFYFNNQNGIEVDANGPITLNTVKAGYNGFNGALLKNFAAQGVTILNGTFIENGDGGVAIRSTGNVLMNHIETNNNGGDGVLIGLRTGDVVTETVGTVTLLNTLGMSWFINNGGDGLQVNANGSVSLTGLNVMYNGGDGVDVITAGTITLVNAQLERNRNHGILAHSGGLMTFNTLRSYNNGYDKFTDSYLGGYDGANLTAANGSITFLNSALSCNGGSGIEADVNLLSGYNLFLINTTYYSNNMEDGGYPDIDKY